MKNMTGVKNVKKLCAGVGIYFDDRSKSPENNPNKSLVQFELLPIVVDELSHFNGTSVSLLLSCKKINRT